MLDKFLDVFFGLSLLLGLALYFYRLLLAIKFGKNKISILTIAGSVDGAEVSKVYFVIEFIFFIFLLLFIFKVVGWLIIVPFFYAFFSASITESAEINKIKYFMHMPAMVMIYWNNNESMKKLLDRLIMGTAVLCAVIFIILISFYK